MPADRYYRDLMNAEIDGVITEDEARILAEHLDADSHARLYYEQLRRTVALLDEARATVAPAELKERILGAVRKGKPAAGSRPAPAYIDEHRRGSDGRRSWMRGGYVTAFAAGMAAGLLLLAAIVFRGDRPPPSEDLGATIGLDARRLRALDERAVDFEGFGVSGSVSTAVDKDGATLLLRISSGIEASLLFQHGADVAFEGLATSGGAPFRMEVDRESVLILHQGSEEYALRLRPAATAPERIELKIFAEGALVALIPFGTR